MPQPPSIYRDRGTITFDVHWEPGAIDELLELIHGTSICVLMDRDREENG